MRLWLTFDNISGSTVYDKSSYLENGSLQWNTRPAQGYFGRGIYLDGSGDRVHVNNFMENRSLAEFTIIMWIKLESLPSELGYSPVLFRISNVNLFLVTGDVLYLNTIDSSNHYVRGDTHLQKNVWYHVAAVYNSTYAQIYLNGLPDDSSPSWAVGPLNYTEDILQIAGTGSQNFKGYIDEVMFFDRALKPQEINASYNANLFKYYNNFTNLSSGNYSYTAYVMDRAGNTNQTSRSFVISGPATMVSSIIIPSPDAFVNDTLRGYCNASDPDDVSLYYHYSWFLNNVLNSSGTVGPFSQSLSVNVANVSSSLLSIGQNWTLQCVADDLSSNSSGLNSSITSIIPRIPEKVVLKSPTNGNNTVHSRQPLFEWYAANHSVWYEINITSSTGCGGNYYQNVSAPSVTFIPSNELCVYSEGPNTLYYWQVRACSDDVCGNWSDIWNFSIEPYIVITIVNNSINFGSMILGETKNTTQGNPGPFVLQNDGNVPADLINVSVDQNIWSSVPLNTYYFQIKARESYESGSFNVSASIMDWINAGNNASLIKQLNYSDAKDSAYVDVQVTVPGDEPPGVKQAYLIFRWTETP
ncbi:MAG: hypothetical protein KatS3mg002_1501 [Candidatus Woesearchaeota archaeon]|nr:MAG: hypothetical protein KatS3mg002_1501 [Candidatus Woesearchaeota archaeon]